MEAKTDQEPFNLERNYDICEYCEVKSEKKINNFDWRPSTYYCDECISLLLGKLGDNIKAGYNSDSSDFDDYFDSD